MINDFSPAVVEARIQAAIRPQLRRADRLIMKYKLQNVDLTKMINDFQEIVRSTMHGVGRTLQQVGGAMVSESAPPSDPVPASDHACLW